MCFSLKGAAGATQLDRTQRKVELLSTAVFWKSVFLHYGLQCPSEHTSDENFPSSCMFTIEDETRLGILKAPLWRERSH